MTVPDESAEMPEDSAALEPPLPPVVTGFAPWRVWTSMRPWKQWVLGFLLLTVGYIESPVLIIPVLKRYGQKLPEFVNLSFHASLKPLEIAYDNSTIVKSFYTTQFERADAVLDGLGFH